MPKWSCGRSLKRQQYSTQYKVQLDYIRLTSWGWMRCEMSVCPDNERWGGLLSIVGRWKAAGCVRCRQCGQANISQRDCLPSHQLSYCNGNHTVSWDKHSAHLVCEPTFCFWPSVLVDRAPPALLSQQTTRDLLSDTTVPCFPQLNVERVR